MTADELLDAISDLMLRATEAGFYGTASSLAVVAAALAAGRQQALADRLQAFNAETMELLEVQAKAAASWTLRN